MFLSNKCAVFCLNFILINAEQVLFANVTDHFIALECASNDFTNAIAWITPRTQEFATLPTVILGNDYFVLRNLTNINQFETSYLNNVPILDYTWEYLPIIFTKAVFHPNIFKFHILDHLTRLSRITPAPNIDKDKYNINLSVLAEQDAQIFLCDGDNPISSTCVSIILGGWLGKKSVLLHCGPNEVQRSEKEHVGCKWLQEVDGNPVSLTKWTHITIRYENKMLMVIADKTIIFNYEFHNFFENSSIYLTVHSYNRNALWKHHQYQYYIDTNNTEIIISRDLVLKTDTWCLSFFSIHAENIIMQLINSKNKIVYSTTYKPNRLETDKELLWEFRLFRPDNFVKGTYQLKIKKSHRDKLYLRELVVNNNCPINQFRLSKVPIYKTDANKIRCTPLLDQNTQLQFQLVSSSNYTTASIRACSTCGQIFDSSECPHEIVCEMDCPNAGTKCNTLCAKSNICHLLKADKIIDKVSIPITFLDSYAKSDESISIRWKAPFPSTFTQNAFNIEYVYFFKQGSKIVLSNTITSNQHCDIWKDYYCTTITNLQKNYVYAIKVTAMMPDIGFSVSNPSNEIVVQTAVTNPPDEPQNVQGYWDESGKLGLSWQHPNRTHGPFMGFNLRLNDAITLSIYQPINFTYTFNTNIVCSPAQRSIRVDLTTVSTKFQSKPHKKVFDCPT